MTQYIDVPIDSDPQDILADAYAYLQAVIPGWTPAQGNLDVWLLESIASAAAELKDVASAVPTSIFRWFGANLANVPPIDATPATATITITVQDNAGYTIPDGTQVSIDLSGDVTVPFVVVGDQIIVPGNTVLAGIPVSAVEAGAIGSGLGSVGGVVHLLDPLSFVVSITQDVITGGGVDAETDTDYLNRLATELQLLAPRPILPNDFAVLARNIAGVFRSTAIDGYNPADSTYNNARMITVAAIDALGNPVSAPIKAAIQASLDAQREVNFIVNTVDPTVTQIDVIYQIKALAGFDLPTLVNDINLALAGYLNPATWGVLPGADVHDWSNLPVVRYLEVAAVINSVDGVDYITTTGGNYDLTIGIHGGALARADVALPGVAPLPSAGTLTGVAT